MCAVHCVQLLHTILHRTDLIIFRLALQHCGIICSSQVNYGRPIGRAILFWSCAFFFFLLFFLAYSHTIFPNMMWPWCEFTMQVSNMLHADHWKYRRQKLRKYRHLHTIAQLCRALSSQLRHVSTIGENLLNSNLHMSSQYGKLRPTNGWDQPTSLGHPIKFRWVSSLGFITAPASLKRGQPNFARCLAVSWAVTLYIHFGGSYPLTEFCQVQNSLCGQVLRSPILAALLHGAGAVDVRQLCGVRQRVPPIFSGAAITLGIGAHSSCHIFRK